jgi:hypothetical protein
MRDGGGLRGRPAVGGAPRGLRAAREGGGGGGGRGPGAEPRVAAVAAGGARTLYADSDLLDAWPGVERGWVRRPCSCVSVCVLCVCACACVWAHVHVCRCARAHAHAQRRRRRMLAAGRLQTSTEWLQVSSRKPKDSDPPTHTHPNPPQPLSPRTPQPHSPARHTRTPRTQQQEGYDDAQRDGGEAAGREQREGQDGQPDHQEAARVAAAARCRAVCVCQDVSWRDVHIHI